MKLTVNEVLAVRRNSKNKRTRQPSMKTLMRWEVEGFSKATDGCVVEVDGTCPHDCKSWLLKLGLV